MFAHVPVRMSERMSVRENKSRPKQQNKRAMIPLCFHPPGLLMPCRCPLQIFYCSSIVFCLRFFAMFFALFGLLSSVGSFMWLTGLARSFLCGVHLTIGCKISTVGAIKRDTSMCLGCKVIKALTVVIMGSQTNPATN